MPQFSGKSKVIEPSPQCELHQGDDQDVNASERSMMVSNEYDETLQ